MADHIVETTVPVTGVETEKDVVKCLQSLYDEFARLGLGQATFEITEQHTVLYIKHKDSIEPDLEAVDHALRAAGNYSVAKA